MKLVARQAVEGTMPIIYIGHRTYRDRAGKTKASKTWYAEWCAEGQRSYERLATTNKATAVKSAHRIVQRIESGQPNPRTRRARRKPGTVRQTSRSSRFGFELT